MTRKTYCGNLLWQSGLALFGASEGLSNQDRHHFDREGQRILGGRYYDAFKSL